MSRRNPDEGYELREVADALGPAAAYRDDDGHIIVEVDEQVRGRARARAIAAALTEFRRRELGIMPLPLLAAAWEMTARWVREHQRATAAVTGAAVTAAVGAAALAATGQLERTNRPPAAAVTIVRTVAPSTPAYSPPAATRTAPPPPSTPARTPRREPQPEASRNVTPPSIRARPAGDGQPARQPRASTAPPRASEAAPRPSPSRSRSRPATSPPSPAAETRRVDEAGDPPRSAEDTTRDTGRQGTGQDVDPPTVDEPDPPSTAPQPEPAPQQPAKDCSGLIDLEVGVGGIGVDLCLLGR